MRGVRGSRTGAAASQDDGSPVAEPCRGTIAHHAIWGYAQPTFCENTDGESSYGRYTRATPLLGGGRALMTTTTTTALATDKVVMRTEPIQRRSSERIELLLDAAAALIDDHGIDGVTTSAVAKRSASSVGVVYRYFRTSRHCCARSPPATSSATSPRCGTASRARGPSPGRRSTRRSTCSWSSSAPSRAFALCASATSSTSGSSTPS
ncbi:MAG: hypothetical protein CMF57_08735 [Leifsonia sp.]|nr:hypothetical protein [Leifsonia sp.]